MPKIHKGWAEGMVLPNPDTVFGPPTEGAELAGKGSELCKRPLSTALRYAALIG